MLKLFWFRQGLKINIISPKLNKQVNGYFLDKVQNIDLAVSDFTYKGQKRRPARPD